MKAAQSNLFVRISKLVNGMTRDSEGRIKNGIANLNIQNRLVTTFRSFRVKQSGGLVKWFVKGVMRLLGANRSYFKGVNDLLLPNIHKLAVRKTLLRLGIEGSTIKEGGWLDSVAGLDSVKQSVMGRFASAVLGGQDFKAFTNGLATSFTTGGIVEKDIGRRLAGTFIQVDREVQSTYKTKLGLKYALYSHTVKSTSTPFCIKRSSLVYSDDEIEKWNNVKRSGKIPGVDVRIQCHGFGCRANISWLSKVAAEAIVERTGKPINSYN